MKTDLRGLQNAQSLCPSYDAREPWLSDRKSPYLLLLTLLEFVSYATHLPLPQCGLDWRTGHKYDTYPEKGSCSLTVWLGSSLSIIVPTGFIMYPRPGQVNRDPGCDLLPLHDFTDEEAEARGGGVQDHTWKGRRVKNRIQVPDSHCHVFWYYKQPFCENTYSACCCDTPDPYSHQVISLWNHESSWDTPLFKLSSGFPPQEE